VRNRVVSQFEFLPNQFPERPLLSN
jgi:hypothetical protein